MAEIKGVILLFCLLAAFLLSGCATGNRNLYHWGSYESQVYNTYCEPDEASASNQIEKMEADIEVARSKGLPLPPGFRAHLGYLYFMQGKYDLATQSFEAEKQAFPESAALMNRFITQIKGQDA
ncbi:DUF4810 domain-containing protein [Desulfogranum japonicum]|uniref:DUF4810 domain-containing protein n=1 Tax=Desulfogranum japonicum TaxID=231447 RepID=UPI000428C329|nr:DUF4810 domain-containing protein [Desulfogranum japonicum]